MGGCASKPKESDLADPVSRDAPAPSPDKVETETVAKENTNGGENQNEAPLVDLSDPKEEAKDSSSESKPPEAEPVSGLVADKAEIAEEKVEAVAAQEAAPKANVEAAETQTKEPVVEAEEKKSEAPAQSSSQDKSDAPLVIV